MKRIFCMGFAIISFCCIATVTHGMDKKQRTFKVKEAVQFVSSGTSIIGGLGFFHQGLLGAKANPRVRTVFLGMFVFSSAINSSISIMNNPVCSYIITKNSDE